jgi:AcrR family transcriptional regulator
VTSPSIRLTRAESQAQTRARLVATARAMFLRDGYASTSLERVAEEAGYSKGAVYSNFGGKDDLCLAVLDSIQSEVAEAVLTALDGAATFDEALQVFDLWAEARLGDPEWSALEAEFAARARRHAGVRRALLERDQALHAVIAGALERTFASHGLVPLIPVTDMAAALLSLGIGLGLQRSVNPALPVRVLSDVARALVGERPATQRGATPGARGT